MAEKATLREMGYEFLFTEKDDLKYNLPNLNEKGMKFLDELNRVKDALNEGFLDFTLNNGEPVSLGFNTRLRNTVSDSGHTDTLYNWISCMGFDATMYEIGCGHLTIVR